jgi:sugar phosphate isomerase/epimerase
VKLGFLTRDMADIEKAARLGFPGVELGTQAFGNAAAAPLDADRIAEAKRLGARHGVEITALAYYDLAFDPPTPGAITTA